jgi:ATP-dependent HslUV protease ATP-binding subunit HslU
MSKLLNELLFDVPDKIQAGSKLIIDAKLVKEKLNDLVKNKDLSEFIL